MYSHNMDFQIPFYVLAITFVVLAFLVQFCNDGLPSTYRMFNLTTLKLLPAVILIKEMLFFFSLLNPFTVQFYPLIWFKAVYMGLWKKTQSQFRNISSKDARPQAFLYSNSISMANNQSYSILQFHEFGPLQIRAAILLPQSGITLFHL